jgi:hypothetical protein
MQEPNLGTGRSRALGTLGTALVVLAVLAALAGCGGGDEPDEPIGGPGAVTMIVSRSLPSDRAPAARFGSAG